MKVPRKLKWFLTFFIPVAALTALMTIVDYKRAKTDRHPRFSLRTAFYLDGGTREYAGLGYSSTFHQKRSIRIDEDGSQYEEILYGPDYKHWILPLKHRNVRTIVNQISGPNPKMQEAQQGAGGKRE